MKSKINAAFLALSVCFSSLSLVSTAKASTWSNSTVGYVNCYASGTCGVTLNSTAPTPPSCATTGGTMTIDRSTSAGEDILKVILAAKAAGWTVTLTGTGTCTTLSYQEDIDHVQIH